MAKCPLKHHVGRQSGFCWQGFSNETCAARAVLQAIACAGLGLKGVFRTFEASSLVLSVLQTDRGFLGFYQLHLLQDLLQGQAMTETMLEIMWSIDRQVPCRQRSHSTGERGRHKVQGAICAAMDCCRCSHGAAARVIRAFHNRQPRWVQKVYQSPVT